MPPEWMWPFDDEISIWFERVNAERREKYGTDTESRTDPPGSTMMDNELAKDFAKAARA